MTPPSFPRLSALAFVCVFFLPLPVAAYQEYHPGLAVEWVGTADGEVTDAVLADADGDGFPDLFLLSGQRLQVWRNDGHGVFAVPTSSVCPLPLVGIVVADVDHDGRVDVVGALAGTAGLAFVRGLGGGLFADPVVLPMGGISYRHLVPLDASSSELIATREAPGSGFDLLRREGDAYVVVTHTLEGQDLSAAIAADVDGDGVVDVIAGAWEQAVEVMLRRGNTFEHAASLAVVPPYNKTLAAVDLDGDGHRDIVAGQETGEVQLFFNVGDGRDWSSVNAGLYGSQIQSGIVAADVDQDGRDELFVGRRWSLGASYVAEYQCTDDPLLEHPAWFSYMFCEYSPLAPDLLLTGDLNGDGLPDLVAINGYGSAVPHSNGIHRGMIGAILTRPDGWPGAIRMLPQKDGVTTARFHAHGASDLLLSGSDGLAIASFGADGTIGAGRHIGDGLGATVIDLDGDGLDDLIVTMGGGQLDVRLTGPDGVPSITTAHLSGRLVSTGDLDHDGRPELLLEGTDGRLSVAWSDPHARFRKITPLPIDATSPWPRQAKYVIADVDGDGRGELVELVHHVAHSIYGMLPDSVQTYRIVASGLFKPIRLSVFTDLIYPDRSLADVRAADLDGRPGQEVVFESYYSGNDGSGLHVLLAQPDGSFRAGTHSSLFGESPEGLTFADLDADGDLDVVTGAAIGGFMGMLHIYWNNGGDLSEVWSRRIAGGTYPSASAGDLDGDGVTDLLIGASPYESPNDGKGQIGTLYGAKRAPRTAITRSMTSPARGGAMQIGKLSVQSITPNPARSSFAVRWASLSKQPATVDLVDLAGRRLRTMDSAPSAEGLAIFDGLDAFAPGVYWVLVRQGKAVAVQRLALVR